MQALSGAGRVFSSNIESFKDFLDCTSLRVSMSDPYLDVHLPRLRCPRAGGIRSPCKNDGLCPARTPRRRYGRLAAGAAVALFTPYLTSAIACQGFLFSATSSSSSSSSSYAFACWPSQRSVLRSTTKPSSSSTPPTSNSDLRPLRKRRASKISSSAGDRDGGDAVDWDDEENETLQDPRSLQLGETPLDDDDGDLDDEEGNELKRVRGASAERSESVIEELLLFFFQLDLGTRLQRALNQDQYEAAQQLREKISEVEREVARQRASKAGAAGGGRGEVGGNEWAGGGGVVGGGKAADQTLAALRVRSDLQKAIEEERYGDAAKLRDRFRELQAESLALAAQSLAGNGVTFRFRLGQRVRHALYNYRGVICGLDAVCYESEEWTKRAGIGKTPRGRNQPFYHVLGDMGETSGFIVTYVAEDRLLTPPSLDLEDFEHPYTYLLFYGKDKMGDYIPTKQLRQKFNAPRYEVKDEDRDRSRGRGRGNDTAGPRNDDDDDNEEDDSTQKNGRGRVAENSEEDGRSLGSGDDDNDNSSISGSGSGM